MSDALSRIKTRQTTYPAGEGTFLHDAFSPVAGEIDMLTDVYLPSALDSVMPDTAVEDDLDRVAGAYGMTRQPATTATGEVTFTGTALTVIPAGTLVSTESGRVYATDIETTIPDGNTTIIADVTAMESGAAYNMPAASLTVLPLALVGVTAVTNAEAISGGADIESDASLRERLLMRIRYPSASGCAADYVRWAREISGIAAASCVPLWDGAGTVKVVVAGAGMTPVGAELLGEVADYIETVRPIGADVTVVSVTSLTVNVAATLVMESGYTVVGVQDAVEAALGAVIAGSDFAATSLPIAHMGAALLTVPGVSDYSGLTLNGSAANVSLTSEQVPALGTVTLS